MTSARSSRTRTRRDARSNGRGDARSRTDARPRSRPPVDPRVLERVRALLAKAESTSFPDEAEALSAKAQELMARHAVDRAALQAAANGATPGVDRRTVTIPNPYAKAKVLLLTVVAEANRCRAVWTPAESSVELFGDADDLDTVELLFTSLLVQATRAVTALGPQRDGRGRSRTRSFRGSFLAAYAVRIGERLRAATDEAARAGTAAHGHALVPVLEARAAAADAACAAAHPRLGSTKLRATNGAGIAAGRFAADRAALGAEPARLGSRSR